MSIRFRTTEAEIMMPRISFFTDSKPTSDRIETELRRRELAYNRLAAKERPYSPLPGVQIGDTYLAGAREINEYLFRLLDEGYVYLSDGTPVLESSASELEEEVDQRLVSAR
jgi:hypothetical protein